MNLESNREYLNGGEKNYQKNATNGWAAKRTEEEITCKNQCDEMLNITKMTCWIRVKIDFTW